ncbi:MAG: DeoR family transcriptional regulator [Candidatus Heimdallarchaeota archaeon]|nr:DeoR family transcriptional regulator [Candidatus Heimdallarchaeota archaeon]
MKFASEFPIEVKQSKLKSMPPATIAILKAFKQGQTITTNELKDLTGYSTRTIRYSLRTLLEEGIIQKHINLKNMRVAEYKLNLISRPIQDETKFERYSTEKLKSSMAGLKHPK